MNNWIALTAILGFLAGVAGIVLLLRRHRSPLLKGNRLLLFVLLLLGLFVSVSNTLEWTSLSVAADHYEDFIEIFKAFLFGILIYSVFQNRLLEQVRENETRYRGICTEMRQSQAQREELLHKLEFKNRELQSIVYIASHDLKSPLVNILGFNGELRIACRKLSDTLETLKQPELLKAVKPLVFDIQEAQTFIESGGRKMEVLINGLLTVSRIGTQPIHIERVDMNAMVESILRTMKFQIQTSGACMKIKPLPDCMADAAQINQVFTNLTDNALKYLDPSRPGEITISGELNDLSAVYRVTDNGIGIRKQYFENIFEIYHRLDPTDEKSGQGLGLTIVNRIMERLNGSISVESEYGKGSTFIIRLPAAV
jgi:signal transduction histidine kinase